ncbi:MAG: hypothetical protein V1892_00435 [bacterium]
MFNINFEQISQNPLTFAWFLFTHGGWIVFVVIVFWGSWLFWVNWVQAKFARQQKYVLLAIDVPKENEQSPKAVENMFYHIAGAHKTYTLYEKYWQGALQAKFSLEIVSIGGYVQFLIYTPVIFRDLIEASIYAQYPEAEITEVEDYTKNYPTKFPNEEYNLWGTEFIYTNKWQYPIRTYPQFEHSLSQEYKDTMAAMLESLSKLQKGECAWFQLILTVTDYSWIKQSKALAEKLIGKKQTKKGAFGSGEVGKMYDAVSSQILGGATATTQKKEELRSQMLYLSPIERLGVEAIENKASKTAFLTKVRYVYIAKKEIFSKTKGVSPIIGTIKQFNDANLNGLKPGKITKTDAHYFFVNWRLNTRRTKIMAAYKNRSNWSGQGKGFIMNTEELATLYHFPTIVVKAPLVKKVEAKRAGPPIGLPIEGSEEETLTEVTEEKAPPPENPPA